MKRKYYPIYAVVFSFVVLVVVSFRFYQVLEERSHGRPQPIARSLPEVRVPGVESVREMARLEEIMTELSKPKAEKSGPIDFRPFGYQPQLKNLGRPGGEVPFDLAGHSLSMVFVGEQKGFCIIDGRFYPSGSSLPDGSRIVRVKRDGVLLKNGQGEKWIMMKKLEESFKTQPDRTGEPLS